MKPKTPSVRSVAFLLFVSSIPAIQAGDITWSGGGADNNWSTPLNWGGVAPVANDSLFFGGGTRLTPSNNILADTLFSGITFNSDAGVFTTSGNRITLGGDITNNSVSLQTINNNLIIDSTRSISAGAGGVRLGGIVSGNGGLKNTGTGTLTLLGTGTNTYLGLTSIEGGRLILGKTSGATAVAGNLSVTGGGVVTFAASGTQNQIANDSSVTINGAGSTFNGTGANVGAVSVTETIGSITVNDGFFNTGGTGVWTIAGAGIFDGTTGDTRFIGNSGSTTSFGSLSLIGMTGTTIVSAPDSFVVGGANGTTMSSLTIGSGGLSLNGSILTINRGTSASEKGSRLILNGDVSVSGAVASSIQFGSGTTTIANLELSSIAGSHIRTIDTAGSSELSIFPNIVNGAATDAGIVKTGTGLLRLSGTNSYNGNTAVSQGNLTITGAAALPGFETAGRYSVASGTTLAVYNTLTETNIANMLATGNFAAGAGLGLDTTTANRTFTATLADTSNGLLNLTKQGANSLTLTADNSYTGVTTIREGTLQLGNNTTTGSIANSSAIVVETGATLRVSRSNTTSLTQAISGGGGITTSNTAGALTELAGSLSNTYTGLTLVGNGTLRLAKTGTATAVGGDLTISTGNVTYLAGGVQNQIADTSVVTISSGKTLNGTGSNSGVVHSITETIGQLVVNGGIFNAGNASKWTVTGAASFNGGIYVGNSGASGGVTTFGSLALTGMNGTGAITTSNTFGIGGSNLTSVVVGAGGLSLNDSSVKLSTSAAGSRIILDGNVSTTGTAATGISVFSGDGVNARIELSSTSGSHSRTFDVGADAPLTIAVAVNRGAATTAGIIKEGVGLLSLEGAASNYNGSTVVNGGTLRVASGINSSTSLSVSNARLQLGVSNALSDTAAMSLANATFDTGGFSDTLGVLSISGDNTLDLGDLASVMRFANSSSATWGSTLSILNWTGDVMGGGTDQVFFGTNASGLTPSQLASITFLNPEGYGAGTYAATFLANGELIPVVPEPSALILLAVGASGLLLRRKRSA